jgi:hypothetical protein
VNTKILSLNYCSLGSLQKLVGMAGRSRNKYLFQLVEIAVKFQKTKKALSLHLAPFQFVKATITAL